MNAMKFATALTAAGVAVLAGTTQVVTQAQAEPRIQVDARIVLASRDAAGKFGVELVPQPADSPARGLSSGSLSSVVDLDTTFSALERAGKGRVLARPSLVLVNDTEGELTHGFQVPMQSVKNNTVTVTWQDAALDLTVRPSVTPANTVAMHVALSTPAATGTFMTREGTLVIGGIALGPNSDLSREVLVFLTPRIVQ